MLRRCGAVGRAHAQCARSPLVHSPPRRPRAPQIVKDYEDPREVNAQLEALGYNMGTRLADDFCARQRGAGEARARARAASRRRRLGPFVRAAAFFHQLLALFPPARHGCDSAAL